MLVTLIERVENFLLPALGRNIVTRMYVPPRALLSGEFLISVELGVRTRAVGAQSRRFSGLPDRSLCPDGLTMSAVVIASIHKTFVTPSSLPIPLASNVTMPSRI
jgi:hypothetical protein